MNPLLPSTPEIDFREALDQMGGDVELLHEVVGVFLETAQNLFREIDESLAEGDLPRLQTVAHGLKGSAASIGALEFSAVAGELEILAMQGEGAGAPEILSRLRESLTRLAAACAMVDWESAVCLES